MKKPDMQPISLLMLTWCDVPTTGARHSYPQSVPVGMLSLLSLSKRVTISSCVHSSSCCCSSTILFISTSTSMAPSTSWRRWGGRERDWRELLWNLFFTLYQQREEPVTPLNRSDWQSEAGTNPLPFCVLVLWTLLGMRNDSPLVCRLRGRGCVGCADGEWVRAAGRCNRRCGRARGSNRSPTQRSRAHEPVPSGSRRGWVQPTTSETPLQDKPAPAGQTGGGEGLLTFNW